MSEQRVRKQYAAGRSPYGRSAEDAAISQAVAEREFDTWLAAHDEAIRAEERERIATAIEAVDPIEWALAGERAGTDAAAIARAGGAS